MSQFKIHGGKSAAKMSMINDNIDIADDAATSPAGAGADGPNEVGWDDLHVPL